ncbi:VCBS repeat-containing protein [Candidatus Poribacteria bacterium]|nr:VCBS repeat-containing protein [Candidatus Poribacteria bacterium]
MSIPRLPAYRLLLSSLLLLGAMTSDAESDDGGHAHAARGSHFNIISLKRPTVVLLASSGDLNGDGTTDLLLFHKPSRESFEKTCSIYFQQGGIFASEPQAEIRLGKNISAVDIDDVDSNGMDELCGFDSEGMVVFKPTTDSAAKISRRVQHQTLLPRSSRRLVEVNWTADLNSDNKVDVILPVVDGFRLFLSNGKSGFLESREFEFPLIASVAEEGGQDHLSYRLPMIEFNDFDKDKKTDVGMFDIERMDFILTGGSDSPTRHVSAPLIREFTKDFIAATDFRDLNADGVPDAVIALMSQKKDLESEVRIYLGNRDFSYGSRPAHTYGGKARLVLPVFLDATGDGKMEMLLQDISVGFSFFINYFIANRIAVEAELRKLGSDGRYEDSPSVSRTIYISVSDSGSEPARGTGDFNGDGLEDLAVGTSEDQLSFYFANHVEILPNEPDSQLRVPAYGDMTTMDLNSDGRTDIVITYPDKAKQNLTTLLLSK